VAGWSNRRVVRVRRSRGEELTDTKIAFLVANEGIEQVELTEPWKAVVDAGDHVHDAFDERERLADGRELLAVGTLKRSRSLGSSKPVTAHVWWASVRRTPSTRLLPS
jgi:hypothetical protein